MKKISLIVLFLWLGIMGASAQNHKYDLNEDGEVNVTDVTLLINYILDIHEAIDLGLPSGTKWASCNVGASKPEEYGGYYAWGETEEKVDYDWKTYKHCQGYYDGLSQTYFDLGDISGTKNDVAHVKWGGNWYMPTLDDIKELINNCTSEWTTFNDVNGYKFTSKINGKSIFLPAAGYRLRRGLSNGGNDVSYWSSSQYIKSYAFFLSGSFYDSYYRYYGRSVRPVYKK